MALSKPFTMKVVQWTAVCIVSTCVINANPQPPDSLSDAQIDEALRLARDEKAAQTLLNLYVLQTRTGIGNGPVAGRLSTPFSRVVLAAVAAVNAGQTLGRDDVPSDLLFPEVLVIATAQPAADADNTLANVVDITIAKRIGTELVDVLLPLRVRAPTSQERKLYGTDKTAEAKVAVFSLEALAPIFDVQTPVVVRVSFDRVAKGTTPLTGCKDCVVAISPRIR